MKRNILCAAGGAFIILGAILLVIGGWHALLARDLFRSSVGVAVSYHPAAGWLGSSNPTAYDPHWFQTELERFQSQSILQEVITNLNLRKEWATKFKLPDELPVDVTYRLLRERIEVRQTHGTSLVEIKVTSADKQEAARIANEIARVFCEQRLDALRTGAANILHSFSNTLASSNFSGEPVERLRQELRISADDKAALRGAIQIKLRDPVLERAVKGQTVDGSPLVEIVDPAEPAPRPFYPNRPLTDGVALLGLLFIAGGLVFLAHAVRQPALIAAT